MQACQPIGLSAATQFLKPRDLFLFRGHDHFAANAMRDAVLAAKIHHRCRAGHTQASLQRSRLVIHARMDDSTVVAALVCGNPSFLFENKKTTAGKTARDLQRDSQAHHPGPYNDYVVT
jgi:hypothetical protein